MPDTPPLTARDFDPWQLATPPQLLTLCQRLGVSGIEVARWLRVPPSSVSMWLHGTRAIPPKHIPALLERTRLAFAQSVELNDKAVALAPTEDLRRAIRAEFAAIWQRWKNEVLREAGTLRRNMQANYQALGQWLAHEPFAAGDLESVRIVMDTIAQQVALLMELEGVAPDPEQALLDRLTAAHEAAQQAREQAQDPGSQTTNPSTPKS
jgi:hypothetical protein